MSLYSALLKSGPQITERKTNFTVFINFQEFHILLHTYSLEQTKNVLRVAKSRQITTF